MRSYRTYWRVPSATVPGRYWTVVYFGNGQTECHCPAVRLGRAEYPCWHALLVTAIASETALRLSPRRVVVAARRGDIGAQMALMGRRASWLAANAPLSSAALATRTQHSYMKAMQMHEDAGLGILACMRIPRDQARRAKVSTS